MFEFIHQSKLSNRSDPSYSSDPFPLSIKSISPPPFLLDKISFELFRIFSLPAPQISLELFRGVFLPFSRGDIEGLKISAVRNPVTPGY